MKDKQIIKAVKKALKDESLYSPAEIAYMKRAMDSAIMRKAKKKFLKNPIFETPNE